MFNFIQPQCEYVGRSGGLYRVARICWHHLMRHCGKQNARRDSLRIDTNIREVSTAVWAIAELVSVVAIIAMENTPILNVGKGHHFYALAAEAMPYNERSCNRLHLTGFATRAALAWLLWVHERNRSIFVCRDGGWRGSGITPSRPNNSWRSAANPLSSFQASKACSDLSA